MQKRILQYREDRIANFKLVFPKLGVSSVSAEKTSQGPETNKNATSGAGALTNQTSNSNSFTAKRSRKVKVSTAVAPATMFQHMKGQNNADVIQTVKKFSDVISLINWFCRRIDI